MRKDHLSPKYIKSRGQSRSYNHTGYQNRSSRSDSRNRGQYGNNRLRQDNRDNNFQRNTRGNVRQNNREEYRDNRGSNRSRERTFSRNYGSNRDRSSSNSRSRSGSRASTQDRIRCYNCREYDHFARDCPNSREERDLEQLQQMLNLEAEEQTHLLTSRQDSPTQNYRSPLNLQMVGMAPLHSYPLDSKIGG